MAKVSIFVVIGFLDGNYIIKHFFRHMIAEVNTFFLRYPMPQ